MPDCQLIGHPFCMALCPNMCKCRVYEKRLVQDKEAKGSVTAVLSCLMGVTEKKDPIERKHSSSAALALVPNAVMGSPSMRIFKCNGQGPKPPAPGRG